MKNDESAFDSIQISCRDSTCKNSNCTFGELKNSYDMVKYLPMNLSSAKDRGLSTLLQRV